MVIPCGNGSDAESQSSTIPRLRIVSEKSVEVTIGHPKIPAFPADAVRTVTGNLILYDPRFRIDAIYLARRRYRKSKIPAARYPHLCPPLCC